MAYKFDIILDILKAIAFLPEQSQLRIIKASVAYLKNTESVTLQDVESMAFTMLLPMLEKEKEKELKLSQLRSQSGKQGGRGKAKKANALLALGKETSSSSSPTPLSTSPKEILNLDNNSHTYAREEIGFDMAVAVCATEEQYARQYRKENMWADAAMSAHLPIEDVKKIFEDYLVEQRHNSTTHDSYPAFKRHFLNYLRVAAEGIRKQSKQQNNGTQRKYDDRRSTEVSMSANFDKPL